MRMPVEPQVMMLWAIVKAEKLSRRREEALEEVKEGERKVMLKEYREV